MSRNEYTVGENRGTRRPGFGGPRGGGPGGPMMMGEKPRNFKASISKLIAFCRPYWAPILLALAFAIAGTVLTILAPDRLAGLTDIISEGLKSTIDIDAIVRVCLQLVLFYGISALLSLCQSQIMTTVNQRVSWRLRDAISKKINRLPLGYFDRVSYGDVLSRVTNDVDTIGQTMQQSVSTLVTSVTLILGSMLMMFITNALLALTAIAAAILGFVLMILIISHSQKYFRQQQQNLGKINGLIEETYAGHTIVKAYNGVTAVTESFRGINGALYASAWKSQFFSGLMMPIMNFIGNLGYVAVCVVGAVLAMNGTISFGVIVAFIVYVRLFTQPLSQIAQASTSLQSTAAASERVFQFLDEEELLDERHKTMHLDHVKGDVEFCHVGFSYEPEKPVIKDFSAHIRAGQKVAIVGPTGAGKTTLVNLLMRFYELDEGEIRVDGVPLTELRRENVHQLFGMVLQDTWLFEGTIRENVAYSKTEATDEQVRAACKAVGLDHFICSLPKGYDTVLNDRASLSAGQKQLMTIARAMVENAPLIILDEATSSVDTRTEALVQQAMDRLTEGRTAFVIAHRLSTIRNADIILVIRDGDVVESGNHEALLQKGGFYAELYNAQFEVA